MNYDIIRNLIKKKREERGLTLDELSDVTRLSKASLSRFERGITKKMKPAPLKILCENLGIDEDDYLFGNTNQADNTLTIGFAHAIWSAPLILSLCDFLNESESSYLKKTKISKKDLEFVSFGTFSLETLDKNEDNEPFFFHHERSNKFLKSYKFKELYLKKNNIYKYTYTAKHLFHLLDNNEVDVIAVAGKLTEKKSGNIILANFLKVANQGCELVVFSNKNQDYLELNPILKDSYKYLEETLTKMIKSFYNNSQYVLNTFWVKKYEDSCSNLISKNNISKRDKKLLNKVINDIGLNEKLSFTNLFSITKSLNIIHRENPSLMEEINKSVSKITLLYANETIASNHYNRFLKEKFDTKLNPYHICLANETEWEATIKDMIFPYIDNRFSHNKDFVAPIIFLGWEPKISHMRELIKNIYVAEAIKLNEISNTNFNLSKSFGSTEDSLFTFDIVGKENVPKGAKNWIYEDTLFDFIFELKRNVEILKRTISSLKDKENDLREAYKLAEIESSNLVPEVLIQKKLNPEVENNNVIENIAHFLNITCWECYTSLKNLEFDHWVNQAWIRSFISKNKTKS